MNEDYCGFSAQQPTPEERYERALWNLTEAQNEVRECERIMATQYAAEQGPPDPEECLEDMG